MATMPSQIYSRKLEWTSNADRLKFNDRSEVSDMGLIGAAIVAFVRSWLGNFRETRKLQTVETHKTQLKPIRWHTGYNPSVSTCGPTFDPQHWHLSLRGVVQCWRGHVYITLLSPTSILAFHLNRDSRYRRLSYDLKSVSYVGTGTLSHGLRAFFSNMYLP